ncbi:hypothetical protein D9756_009645 [Leucocoprinus leucothites]|uniref:Secreted protein n=1 Tax=Leucocoprinus leucothites TaxID=201217 RepID=A0A8H5CWU6_9AGAR|nr:hypothetical protein D9756_009645 [Leucoagaricus leucothites]
MKVFAALLAGLTAVSAQTIMIGAPSSGAQLTAGQSTVVQIFTPNFLSSSKEVSVAIGISSCSSGFCRSPSDTLGNLLYSGTYSPQRDPNGSSSRISENFTVTIPSNIAKGQAILGVAHFALIGASLQPWLETKNVSVVVQ